MTTAFPVSRLQKVADLNPSLDASPADDEAVSFLPMAAVDADAVDAVDTETRPFREVSKGYTPFIADDVLVAKITPCFENGKIAQAKPTRRIGFGSTEFHVIRTHRSELDPRYLVHFLRQERIRKDGERKMTGSAGQRRVPEHFLANLSIPLPPLPEQRRIAQVLDKADALRAKRRAALAQLDSLTQSIFLEMFGDPATNPKGWLEVRLGEHTSKIGSGATPLGGEAAYKTEGIALIRSMNVHDRRFLRDGLAFIDDEQAARLDGVVVQADDVLLNITGASVARVCRAPRDVLPARVNQHVAIVRPTREFDPRFLEQCLLYPSMKRRLLRIAGAGATREAITKDAIERLNVIQPAIELQVAFAQLVRLQERLEEVQNNQLCAADALFSSLQHRAFRGEL